MIGKVYVTFVRYNVLLLSSFIKVFVLLEKEIGKESHSIIIYEQKNLLSSELVLLIKILNNCYIYLFEVVVKCAYSVQFTLAVIFLFFIKYKRKTKKYRKACVN